MLRTEIPPRLLTKMLYRARVARRALVPGTSDFHGTDVAYLAEHWAEHLLTMSLDREDAMLDQDQMDELHVVMTEVTEYLLCNFAELALDGDEATPQEFEHTTEEMLAFLKTAE